MTWTGLLEKQTDGVEVLKMRTNKPITALKATVAHDDDTVALEGEGLCYPVPLPRPAG
jgi:hypothetical protein